MLCKQATIILLKNVHRNLNNFCLALCLRSVLCESFFQHWWHSFSHVLQALQKTLQNNLKNFLIFSIVYSKWEYTTRHFCILYLRIATNRHLKLLLLLRKHSCIHRALFISTMLNCQDANLHTFNKEIFNLHFVEKYFSINPQMAHLF